MYSNKDNVNILTALLAEYGITHAVVCPGSRNAPIVHNLNEHPRITCHPVTDERSAAFYALGMAQCLHQPVVVCVTSGSALLGVLPAVAEAYYQREPLVVISADRPPQWIDQLDGQTLPQTDALGRFVRHAVSLPEPHSDEERWYCNRLVCEALLVTDGPVHINVPISEPLFQFTCQQLPQVRRVVRASFPAADEPIRPLETLFRARRPMLVIGQENHLTVYQQGYVEDIRQRMVVLHEALLNTRDHATVHFDEALPLIKDRPDDYAPDCILYMGGTLVSKRLKHFLRSIRAYGIRVDDGGQLTDTFMNVDYVVKSTPEMVLRQTARACRAGCFETTTGDTEPLAAQPEFYERWRELTEAGRRAAEAYHPAYSQMAAVRCLEQQLPSSGGDLVHYANSTSIRLANLYAARHVWCNRGVNGIEGSLSTAAGFSCVAGRPVVCVIGDLSFFYDQNALWSSTSGRLPLGDDRRRLPQQEGKNQCLTGQLRILLLNNGRGGIFNLLPGLEQSSARDRLVAAAHQTTAEGICRQYGVGYRSASDEQEMQAGITWLLQSDSDCPLLLEVFTDAETDEAVYKHFYQRR